MMDEVKKNCIQQNPPSSETFKLRQKPFTFRGHVATKRFCKRVAVGSLFYDAFSLTRLYREDDGAISEL
jgi:hypothetical protein